MWFLNSAKPGYESRIGLFWIGLLFCLAGAVSYWWGNTHGWHIVRLAVVFGGLVFVASCFILVSLFDSINSPVQLIAARIIEIRGDVAHVLFWDEPSRQEVMEGEIFEIPMSAIPMARRSTDSELWLITHPYTLELIQALSRTRTEPPADPNFRPQWEDWLATLKEHGRLTDASQGGDQ